MIDDRNDSALVGTTVEWLENGQKRSALWRSENNAPAPKVINLIGDDISADVAYKRVSLGESLLWRGDFNNARQLLTAMTRRAEPRPRKPSSTPAEDFHLHRQDQARRARTLGMLLVELDQDYALNYGRAPEVALAATEVYGEAAGPSLLSLRELLSLIGAHEWRRKGVHIPALDASIEPHFGVFSPLRGEYVQLVADTPLPAGTTTAFDIGTGTGVLAAVLAKRGVAHVVATDKDPRAVACAEKNIEKLGLADRVDVRLTDIFPAGRASLVVCNPPWIPTKPTSGIEHAIYDPGNRMLRAFLDRLGKHLEPGGEAWLVISDLAELLGLATREDLLSAIDRAGLAVLGRSEVSPTHSRSRDTEDLFHAARSRESTSLWRLAPR
ncbi:class I SAM-dependent methyltransferase [Rhodococcus sp. G-MC3]|uniref:class I SAM-dependent methyltransferase n=1 Tax=Rhodococcus sp. G-MC3 TaxID=3046209 RepID=UPI0024B8C818|nr:class I SAM-dependent methyltransferase [Rhodococcus sp. G-MC3]MDJ0392939.1 class I SAM-dependent methyltransferase [Rhodococcus sp. G-MC3]